MQDKTKLALRRIIIIVLAAVAVMVLYLLRMVQLQLVRSEYFLSLATKTTSYSRKVSAARGEIVDCYGRSIATNTACYNVVFDNLLLGSADLNENLRQTILLLQKNGEEWSDGLLLSAPDEQGEYTFSPEADTTSGQNKLASLKTNLGLQQYATANDVMAAVVARYKLERYPQQWQRILGGVRYQMEQEGFSNRNTFTLAEDVTAVTVACIKERSLTLAGVDILESTRRSYPDGTVLPHILGRVGKITAERWYQEDEEGNVTKPLQAAGYNMNDTIGNGGLEEAYEDSLRGTNGTESITLDADGAVISRSTSKEAKPGYTLMMTVNLDFQKTVQRLLEETIVGLQNQAPGATGKECNAGAVVVLSTKDNSVLAVANYPNYDINGDYSAYLADTEGTPLVNRAFSGLYTPGSTFKPAIATAAMLSGKLGTTETITCTGRYTYFSDYQPRCVLHDHGVGSRLNVATALRASCNIFFYEAGRRTTSPVYNDYAQRLGLGVKTGVEVNESTGRLTTRNDSNYTVSLEIQAAIGQGNTVITPVQLATYASTIANKGIRYRTHLVKALCDTNTGAIVEEVEPEVVEVIEDEIGAFEQVEKGMILATQLVPPTNTYPYTIALKTGSPQRSDSRLVNGVRKHYDNGTMIAYGPVEDPQIAIGIVLEYGGAGAKAGKLVTQIFDAYFFAQSNTLTAEQENRLLE